jgi:hypothetical protein
MTGDGSYSKKGKDPAARQEAGRDRKGSDSISRGWVIEQRTGNVLGFKTGDRTCFKKSKDHAQDKR